MLLRLAAFVESQSQSQLQPQQQPVQQPVQPPPPELVSLQVTDRGTAFLGFRPGGWLSVDFSGEQPVVSGSVGTTASDFDAATAAFVGHAARWIHADVTWDFAAQRRLLAADARCFGISGREEIVASSEQAFATTAWAIPYAITLDAPHAMVSFDFDVIDRKADAVTGRGTDLVHFASAGNGTVIKIDTLRHVYQQPDWVQQQICETKEGKRPVSQMQ